LAVRSERGNYPSRSNIVQRGQLACTLESQPYGAADALEPSTTLFQIVNYPALAKQSPTVLYPVGDSKSRSSSSSGGTRVLALILVFFVLGLILARFGVLAALLATALSTAGSFTYDLMNGSTFTQALSSGVIFALVLQVGYLVGQVLPPLRG
jgi:hypothetical protein